MRNTANEQLLALVDEAYDHRAWHGPTLRGSLRGVGARAAAWRPGPGRHNVWEVALHAAFWKHVARRRITGGPRSSFALKGHDWFAAPDGDPTDRAWKDAVQLLEEEHRAFREAVAGMGPGDLQRKVRRRDTAAFTIRGIAAHDLYHAGQIQLLRRLMRRGRSAL